MNKEVSLWFFILMLFVFDFTYLGIIVLASYIFFNILEMYDIIRDLVRSKRK